LDASERQPPPNDITPSNKPPYDKTPLPGCILDGILQLQYLLRYRLPTGELTIAK